MSSLSLPAPSLSPSLLPLQVPIHSFSTFPGAKDMETNKGIDSGEEGGRREGGREVY